MLSNPAAPLTSTGSDVSANRANVMACPATAAAPWIFASAASPSAQQHVGMEYLDERLEVARPGGGQERVDNPTLAGHVAVRRGGTVLDPAPGPAGQLLGRGRRPVKDGGDVLEGLSPVAREVGISVHW